MKEDWYGSSACVNPWASRATTAAAAGRCVWQAMGVDVAHAVMSTHFGRGRGQTASRQWSVRR